MLSVAFSPDGNILAAGSRAGSVVLWDVADRKEVGELKHKGAVRNVVFSPDGRMLASASDDRTAVLWDVETDRPLARLISDRQQSVRTVAFSPDGEILASGSSEVAFWNISFEEMRAGASKLAARNLTHEEWKRFLGNEPYRLTSPDGALLEAHRLALVQDTTKAEKAFEELVPWSVGKEDFTLNNLVGWYGSLDGFAKIVLPACDAAVKLASKRTRGAHAQGLIEAYYRREEATCRDTRGVARALVGDTAGAIEDFEAVTQWAEQKHQQDQTVPEEWDPQRRDLLAELKAGRNPFFDSATLKALLCDA